MYFILINKKNYILLLTISAHSGTMIMSSQSPAKLTTSPMGLPPLRDDFKPNSPTGILPTRSPMFIRYANGISPT